MPPARPPSVIYVCGVCTTCGTDVWGDVGGSISSPTNVSSSPAVSGSPFAVSRRDDGAALAVVTPRRGRSKRSSATSDRARARQARSRRRSPERRAAHSRSMRTWVRSPERFESRSTRSSRASGVSRPETRERRQADLCSTRSSPGSPPLRTLSRAAGCRESTTRSPRDATNVRGRGDGE